ncbi:hypothetical protein [Sphingobium limneticum]|uniref:hypothetical protein n=1 Tax=Sphingobium limneticum TaxID=1007511 RepID=UPI00123D41B2|nr:hypothetical protein [Sphingobium limneticum]
MLFATALLLSISALDGGGKVTNEGSPVQPCKTFPRRQKDDATGAVSGLPYARGRAFGSLEEYLEHLRSNAAIDLPWWREIKPGVYEYVSRSTSAPRKIATREQLKACFGFTH